MNPTNELTFDVSSINLPDVKSRCIVRLTTCRWGDKGGVHIKKTLRYLRRKCTGNNILYEDIQSTGADEVVARITNLDSCDDGIYEVVTCNEWASWENPCCIEDYDYKLIPYDIPIT
jgi:hypothetical protein